MGYRAQKRVVIGRRGQTEADVVGVAIHEDGGDGAAKCAVGTQMGKTKPFMRDPRTGQLDEWVPLGPGEVTCELCGSAGDPVRGGSPKRRVAPRDSTAETLDERIARMRAKRGD
jgi:hypothetical protein